MLTEYEKQILNQLEFENGYDCLTPEQQEGMRELQAKRDQPQENENGNPTI